MRLLALGVTLLACGAGLRSEIVDRVAANVGHRVITESEVIEEIKVTAFLENVAPDLSNAAKRTALDRLIDQELMRREIVFTRFPLPTQSDIQPLYNQVLARFPDQETYRKTLASYGVMDSDIRQHIQWQVMALRFIEYRFQPGVQVSESELNREYQEFTRKWREEKKTEPPTFDDVRDTLENVVRQRLIDSSLDRWLGEVRTQNTIVYRKGYDQ